MIASLPHVETRQPLHPAYGSLKLLPFESVALIYDCIWQSQSLT